MGCVAPGGNIRVLPVRIFDVICQIWRVLDLCLRNMKQDSSNGVSRCARIEIHEGLGVVWFPIANACCHLVPRLQRVAIGTTQDMTWLILSPWTSRSTPWRDRCVIQLRFHIDCATNCAEHNSFYWVSRLCRYLRVYRGTVGSGSQLLAIEGFVVRARTPIALHARKNLGAHTVRRWVGPIGGKIKGKVKVHPNRPRMPRGGVDIQL